jgi:hypothetical protein
VCQHVLILRHDFLAGAKTFLLLTRPRPRDTHERAVILIPSSMAGKGKNKARGTPTSGRRVVVVTNGGAPKGLTNTPTTLNERFTQLARKTQGRDAQVQRGTTARYAATMAKRTGLSAKQFQVGALSTTRLRSRAMSRERCPARSAPVPRIRRARQLTRPLLSRPNLSP